MVHKIPTSNMSKEEWTKLRSSTIGGSDAAAILGLNPQQAAPAGFCPICGGEIYRYGEELCDKCKNIEDERNSNYGD